MAGPSLEVIEIISEFAAGGALAAVAIRVTFEGIRKLPPFAKTLERRALPDRGATSSEFDGDGLSDARFLGEALAGALVAAFGASIYLGAYPQGRLAALGMAAFSFVPALWAVLQLCREPLPGEPVVDEGTHIKAWLGFVAALIPLLIGAAEYYSH